MFPSTYDFPPAKSTSLPLIRAQKGDLRIYLEQESANSILPYSALENSQWSLRLRQKGHKKGARCLGTRPAVSLFPPFKREVMLLPVFKDKTFS